MLLTMATTSIGTSELRIVRKYPGIALQRVWKNVNTTVLSDHIKSAWYTAVHEIIPTNERLTAIHLTTTTSCVRCGATDTLLHRLISCEEGSVIWTWTKSQDSGNTMHTPLTHTRAMDPTPDLLSLAPPPKKNMWR